MGNPLIDTLLEKTVVPSFSSLGSSIRSRVYKWRALEEYSLNDRVVVITGATSGIGEAGAQRFAQLGATLVLVARNREKTESLIDSLKKESGNDNIHGVYADLGKQQEVRRVAEEIAAQWPVIDVLIHNAGALFNERKRAESGVDLSVELMVSTPYLLTGLLLNNLKAVTDEQSKGQADSAQLPARVLTMSSGGMYTQPLNVERLEMRDENYQGARQYARAKRAQVILNELWADKVPAEQVVFHALHPGWVNTPGITDALPGFSKVLGPLGLLRSADKGADTMVWLGVDNKATRCSGKFWHDRRVRAIDLSEKTRKADTPEERAALWSWCETQTNWSLAET